VGLATARAEAVRLAGRVLQLDAELKSATVTSGCAAKPPWPRLPAPDPIPASSGNIVRHRLNRGGDRRRNWALNTVVLTRMRTDPATRDYLARRTAEGKTGREIRGCLKRYTTRQIQRTLSAANTPGPLASTA
jgi:hypothetical protein